ncbi:YezD family protein [Bacillus anthracis]|nr:YezD family protein [Bacillus anthracis]MEB9503305.1 YezD family protein [Bacillus anthracis]
MSVREHFEEVSERIQAMLVDMKYGSITIVVQDGKVIQLEKSEKVRLK